VHDREDELAEDSERLLGEVEDLQRLESEKRREPISSPRFHELADAVAAKAREIMYRASRGERTGDAARTSPKGDEAASTTPNGRSRGRVQGEGDVARKPGHGPRSRAVNKEWCRASTPR
jgi:hypothetical protein